MRGGMRRALSATAGRRFSAAYAAIWTVKTSDSACTPAAAFRFGRPRHDVAPASARLVLETLWLTSRVAAVTRGVSMGRTILSWWCSGSTLPIFDSDATHAYG
jgi:hypothetical protein